jgi:hypothetical protein
VTVVVILLAALVANSDECVAVTVPYLVHDLEACAPRDTRRRLALVLVIRFTFVSTTKACLITFNGIIELVFYAVGLEKYLTRVMSVHRSSCSISEISKWNRTELCWTPRTSVQSFAAETGIHHWIRSWTACSFYPYSLSPVYLFIISVFEIDICFHTKIMRSRGSSVSIVSDYIVDDRVTVVWSPAVVEDFSCSLCVQTGSEAHPASCTMDTGSPLLGGKARPGRDTDHLPHLVPR